MKELVQKLLELEKNISAEKGDFLLFALFLREDSPDRWDLLVSAPWISKDKPEALRYLAKKVKELLKTKELIKLSKIVLIDEDNPALDAIYRDVNTKHRLAEIRDSVFFGLPIEYAYFITAQRENSSECSDSSK